MVARRRFRRVLLASWVVWAVGWAGGCGGGSEAETSDDEPAESDQKQQKGVGTVVDERAPRLDFRIDETSRLPDRSDGRSEERTSAKELSDSARERLWEAWPAEEGLESTEPPSDADFAFPASGPEPPVDDGEARSLPAFFGSASLGPDEGPPRVVAHRPEGEVGRRSRLSVVFSKPMVPVGDDRGLAESDVPVDLTPDVEGTWRWIGARTLAFEPASGRFPMATSYRVQVGETEESTGGSDAVRPTEWTFETAPVEPVTIVPKGGPQSPDPLMFMAFNQKVDREAIVDYVQVWGGGEVYPPQPVDREEVRHDRRIRRLVERTPEGHWIAFRIGGPLEPGRAYQVGLERGAPSAEGPKRAEEGTFEKFSTFDAFQIEAVDCGWKGACPPTSDWTLVFNHAVDPGTIEADTVEIRPRLEGREVEVQGRKLVISGRVQPETTYRIRVGDRLRDRFGLKLRRPVASEVEVGPASPGVWSRDGRIAVLGSSGDPTATVASVGAETLRVQVRRVAPEDWHAYASARTAWLKGEAVEWPGESVLEREVDVLGSPDAGATPTEIGFDEALEGGSGHLVMTAELSEVRDGGAASEGRRRTAVWYQATDLSVDAYTTGRDATVWVTSLEEGEPVEGASVGFVDGSEGATTDQSGVARVGFPSASETDRSEHGGALVVERGDDRAVLPEFAVDSGGASSWSAPASEGDVRWFVVEDRHAYRPGETVEARGWIRRVVGGEEGATFEQVDREATVAYRVEGPSGTTWAKGEANRTGDGGFHASFELPEDAEFGDATATWSVEGPARAWTREEKISVREFVEPSVEADLRVSSGPRIVGEPVRLGVEADRRGSPASDVPLHWRVEASSTDYTPPGWDDFEFGYVRPWWRPRRPGGPAVEEFETSTRRDGTGAVSLDSERVTPPEPVRVRAEAAVGRTGESEVMRQTEFTLHPASVYVGLAPESRIVPAGESIDVETVVTGLDGDAMTGREVVVTAERLEVERRGGRRVEVVTHRESCEVTSAEEPSGCEFDPDGGGEYRLTARATDDSDRWSKTTLRIWVAGAPRSTAPGSDAPGVELVPRRRTHRPGEAAEVLVRAPMTAGRGLLVVDGGGATRTQSFRIEEGTAEVDVPIEARDAPEVELRAVVVGGMRREVADEGDESPARPVVQATGEIALKVSREARRLQLDVETERDGVAPGETAALTIRASNPEGESEPDTTAAIAVVDASVLEAGADAYPDPLPAFYPDVEPDLRGYHLRDHLVPPGIGDLLRLPEASGGASGARVAGVRQRHAERRARAMGPERREGPLASPQEVPARPLVHYESALELGDDGSGRLEVQVPERDGTLRVGVVASSGAGLFGRGSTSLDVRRSVEFEPARPRFARVGDRVRWPVVVENHGGEAREVEVAVRSDDRLDWPEGRGASLEVPGGERVETQFVARADSVGEAEVQWMLESDGTTGRATRRFEVVDARRPDRRAVRGRFGPEQDVLTTNILVPEATEGGGRLRVDVESTVRGALIDAFGALVEARPATNEVVASALLASTADGGGSGARRSASFDSFDSDAPSRTTLLAERQHDNGGFAALGDESSTSPAMSVHVLHAMVRADSTSDRVGEDVLERGEAYLRDIESHLPDSWSDQRRSTIRAYALWVLELMGAPEPGEVRMLADRTIGDGLSDAGAGWLLATMARGGIGGELRKTVREALIGRFEGDGDRAHVPDPAGSNAGRFDSATVRDAVVLDGLLRAGAAVERVDPLLRGLLARRRRGRWAAPRENALGIEAVRTYASRADTEADDSMVRGWLGEQYLGELKLGAEGGSSSSWEIPASALRERWEGGDEVALRLERSGSRRPYYRIAETRLADAGEREGRDSGLAVERSYEPLGSMAGVRRDSNGTWWVTPESRVRVVLRVAVPSTRRRVTLSDRVPAGFTPVHADAGTRSEGAVESADERWFDYQRLERGGVEVFAEELEPGVYRYSYVARATTSGRFRSPPARAALLEDPAIRARTPSQSVVVRSRDAW